MFRQHLARNARLFSTSLRVQKGPVETVKDGLKKVDEVASRSAISGLETVESGLGRAKEQTAEGAKEAQRKAEDVKDQAQRTAEEVKDKAQQ